MNVSSNLIRFQEKKTSHKQIVQRSKMDIYYFS